MEFDEVLVPAVGRGRDRRRSAIELAALATVYVEKRRRASRVSLTV